VIGPRDEPPPVLVVVAVLCGDAGEGRRALAALAEPLGGVGATGRAVAFDRTDYYQPEMGAGLARTFASLGRLVAPEELVAIKHAAFAVEQRYATGDRRRVNLDPGYLDGAKVVLASFKPGPYKLYLGRAVWADTVLYFADGRFQPLPWTFPDLRHGPHVEFLTSCRSRYRQLLRSGRTPR
jgi:hypothetical protein